jgi:tight adherence protein B
MVLAELASRAGAKLSTGKGPRARALSAEGRLSAYILIALPFVITGWLFLVRREYISALWTTAAGLMMLAGAAVLMVIGIFWMMRWMKVEV